MRRLHLLWTHLPLRLARARSDSFPTGPVVLGGQPWVAGTVLDANPAATELGVHRGMPLGSAHRLAPEATFLDPDPGRDGAAIEAALERLATFSPGVAGAVDPADPAFGLIEVQVDGLDRLWGPSRSLPAGWSRRSAPILPGRLEPASPGRASPRRSPPPPPHLRPAIGDGRIGRWLNADRRARRTRRSSSVRCRPACSRPTRISGPGLAGSACVGSTRWPRVPRSALVARFGEEGGRIHARAIGEELDPFRPRRAPERLCLGIGLEPPIEELEPLRFVLHRLTAALADQLVARGAATGRAACGSAWTRRSPLPAARPR